MAAAKLTYRQVIPINAHHVTITVLKDPDHGKTDICFFNRLLGSATQELGSPLRASTCISPEWPLVTMATSWWLVISTGTSTN